MGEALYLQMYLRAADARAARPILCDPDAAGLADAVGHDFSGLRRAPAILAAVHAARAANLDRLVREFTGRHPDAVVLDLGAGLDTRARRCTPPPGVTWYDVDLPDVVALRERHLPGLSRAVAADFTAGTTWLDGLPRDRPVIAVADGLMAVLPGPAFRATVAAVAGHFRAGEIAFNAYTRAALRRRPPGPAATRFPAPGEGVDDAREPESWAPGLTLREELLIARTPEVDRYPGIWRAVARPTARSDRISRAGDRILRYAFRPSPGSDGGSRPTVRP